jgi:integrase
MSTPARRARAKAPAPAPPADSLADLAGSFAVHLAAERKAAGTMRLYLGTVASFTAWHRQVAAPGMPVTGPDLHAGTAKAYLADMLAGDPATGRAPVSPATARARHASLRQFSKWYTAQRREDARLAQEPEDAITDPLRDWKPPKLDQPQVPRVAGDDLAAMLRACRVPAGADRWTVFECLRDEALLRLLVDTGMRAAECVALRLEDLDLARRTVAITRAKGGRHRISSYSAATARALDRYLRRRRGHLLAGGGRLWLGTANRGFTYHALRGAVGKRAQLAGIEGRMHPHRLRHTAASVLLDKGLAEGDVMALLGWRSRQQMARYVEDTANQRAVENVRRLFDGER